jgi:hypothetical protein
MSHTVLLRDFDVSAAVAVMTAFLSASNDENAMARARHAAGESTISEVTDGLIELGAVLLALLQAEHGGTGDETLQMVSRMGQFADQWNARPTPRIRGPRSFAKFVADSYKAVHG